MEPEKYQAIIEQLERENAGLRQKLESAHTDALRRSEQMMRAVVDATPDWIFIKDQEHRYQLVNKSYADALHIAPEDFTGKNDLDLGFPEELVKGNPEKGIRGFWADDCLVLDSNEAQVYSDVPATIDGVVHTFHTIKVPLRNANGKPWGVLAFARDITERKKAEEELRNRFDEVVALNKRLEENARSLEEFAVELEVSQEQMRETLEFSEGIINAIPDTLFEVDQHGRYLNVWTRKPDLLAEQREALLGKTVHEVLSPESAAVSMASLREAEETGLSFGKVIHIDLPQGKSWFEISVSMLPGGTPSSVRFLVLSRDVTERVRMEQLLRESETRYRDQFNLLDSVLESSSEVIIFALDRDYRYLAFNSKHKEVMKAIWGTDIAVGTDMHEIISSSSDRETARRCFDRTLAGEQIISEDLYGDERLSRECWQNIYSPIRSDAGNVTGLTCFVLNITERKQAELELQRKNSELERFAYTVSHDLKSPIITIKSFSGSIKQDIASGRYDRVEKDLSRIYTAVGKMAVLLDDLLKLSRSGKIIDTPVAVDMALLVGSVLTTMVGTLKENSIQVAMQSGLPTVMCDRQRMMEVVQNLVENAVKYRGEQPEPRIVIGVRSDNGRQVFFVQDNGPGIEPKYHDNIFGLFNRINTRIPGTGIGLALVKRIIETHGGKVWVESDGQGNGSTFCFTVVDFESNTKR